MKISYYAVLQKDEDGLWVRFPDLNGCFSCGDERDIELMAKEAMELYLHDTDINELPIPSPISVIMQSENQKIIEISSEATIRDNRVCFPGIITTSDESFQ